jgi:hypothetical protein
MGKAKKNRRREPAPKSSANKPPAAATALHWAPADAAILAVLASLAIFFLSVSWRKWPDPIVDFGRELYLPWRLGEGAVLYRDVQHFYGPLSQYFHSLLFNAFGVGFTTLVASNLTIYAAILFLLYYIAREGWGRLAAAVAGAIFVAVFSFSHLVGIGNYTYAAPYVHETTHGIALTLLLVLAWQSAIERFHTRKFFFAGLLAGLCVLLKPEFILASAAVSLAGVLLLAQKHGGELRSRRWAIAALCFAAGVILPPLAATAAFGIFAGVPLPDAFQYANNAWLAALRMAALIQSPEQQYFRGTDDIAGNLLRQIVWGGLAVAIAGSVGWACGHWSRARESLYVFTALSAAAGVWAFSSVPWKEIGRTIPTLMVMAALLEAARIRAGVAIDSSTAVRVLLWFAAAALLARMVLNPRVYHYGFYQAPLAAAVGIATLLSAVPDRLALAGAARKCYQALLVVLILSGGGAIARQSAHRFSLQQQAVGTGPDRFYAFDSDVEPSGTLVEVARRYLAADTSAQTLLVLPEGIMLNYLTRLPSTLPNYVFQPAFLTPESRRALLKKLSADPPDRVVILTRDMQEFGVRRFGDSPEHGQELLEFVQDHYDTVYRIGGDPLDPDDRGLVISARRGLDETAAPDPKGKAAPRRQETR